MAVQIGNIKLEESAPLVVIAGPNVLESWEVAFKTASTLKQISQELGFPLIFKSSFDKANRLSIDSFRGPGLENGLKMLADIKSQLGLPLLSDVHEPEQCEPAAKVLDVLQIPAFLCRQTDLIVAAAKTGAAINIKKGQFAAPLDLINSVEKVKSCGNQNVFITERGTTFGYNNLVVDMRSISIIQEQGCPIVFDATHSVQLPGGAGNSSSGQRQYAPILARAAVAAGCCGVFIEVHPDPDNALCESSTQLPLAHARELISQLLKINKLVQSFPKVELPPPKTTKEPVLA